jgi:beta-phosphoglucomutase family hydrolase
MTGDFMLGLPDAITTCLFDLDGVLTDTASVHTKAWKHTFDAYLRARAERTGTHFVPFDPGADYIRYVDGRPRADGVRTFLRSRDIELPEGEPDDPPEAETVRGLGNRKNEELLRSIERDGVEVYAGSRRFLRAAQDAGLRRVVVSSSANTAAVLKATGLAALIEARVDGRTIEAEHLAGKPAPDTFVAGARLVGATPLQAAVFEDAIAGVQAGRAGNFGFVVGVNRHGDDHHRQLREQGADVVVADLAELLSHHAGSRPARQPGGHPSTEGPDT